MLVMVIMKRVDKEVSLQRFINFKVLKIHVWFWLINAF